MPVPLFLRALFLTLFAVLAGPAVAQPVLKTNSGICHCPGGQHYGSIRTATAFDTLQACLATGAREPKSGQGQCPASGAPQTSVQSPMPAAPSAYTTQLFDGYPSFATSAYVREAFGPGWLDMDGNCRDQRHDMLANTSTGNTIFSRNGCRVERGRWNDPYTNRVFTDPSDMDMDHIVPLSFAWHHGADAWSQDTRERFANDPINLMAVDASANRQKSDSGPLKWLPENVAYRCEYITRFQRIALTYKLRFSPQEEADMATLRAYTC